MEKKEPSSGKKGLKETKKVAKKGAKAAKKTAKKVKKKKSCNALILALISFFFSISVWLGKNYFGALRKLLKNEIRRYSSFVFCFYFKV